MSRGDVETLVFEGIFEGESEAIAGDTLFQGEVEVQATAMAGAEDENAAEADTFEDAEDLVEAIWVLVGVVGAGDVNVYHAVASLFAEADTNQLIGVLPLLPEVPGFKGVAGFGLPLWLLSIWRLGGVDELPAVGEEVTQALTEEVSG